MERDEFLRRVDEAIAAKAKKLGKEKLADSAVSQAAGLSSSYIRNQRRKPHIRPFASYLVKLAEWLERPPAYFIDKSVVCDEAVQPRTMNSARLSLAQEVAEETLQNRPKRQRERMLEQLTQELYDVLSEYEEAGAPMDRESAGRLLRSVVVRMVLSRLRSGK